MKHSSILFTTLLLTSLAGLQAVEAPKPFADGDRVMFLGDSITRAGGWHSLIGLYYATRFPNRHITWFNAGISGDIAAGALQRLQWDVLDRKPGTVVVMFGMNECGRPDLPGKIGSDERVELYRTNMTELVTRLKSAGIQMILVTPSPSEGTAQLPTPAQPEINSALTRCAQVARELAEKYALPLVDFNGPMNKIAADFQKTNPAFTLIGNDRTHPGELGCTLMASLFLKSQGVTSVVSETVVDEHAGQLVSSNNGVVSDVIAKDDEIVFTLAENALPMPFEGKARAALHLSPDDELEQVEKSMRSPSEAHVMPGWNCLPVQDALNREIVRITGLAAGDYQLDIDDHPVGCWSGFELEKGVNLAGVRTTPQYQQALTVLQAHAKACQLASGSSRAIAFTRHCTLGAAGVDVNDQAAVRATLDRLINDKAAVDSKQLGFGDFAQAMARNYSDNVAKEAGITASLVAAENDVHRLNQPVPHRYRLRPVGHPLSAAQRQAAFDNRHHPEQVEQTAKEFLRLLILDGPGMLRSTLRMRPGFQAVADLAKAGKSVEAIKAWREYFFEKLRNPAAYGLATEVPYPGRGEDAKILARAEELMQGKLVVDAPPMPPGSVWMPISKSVRSATTGILIPGMPNNPWRPDAFQPLAHAYFLTGERRFLERWIEYMDDWAMHETADAAVSPMNFPDSTNSFSRQIPQLCGTLSGIARMTPTRATDFPADTLVRMLGKLIRVYPLGALVYFESNPQNWTPHTMVGMMQSAMLMDEFKASELLFSRARRRQESYGTIEHLPDGSETEHALWYNRHVYTSCEEALELAATRRALPTYKRPVWESAFASQAWEDQQRSTMTGRARYLLQMLTPQSENPIGNRNDHRIIPGVKTGEEFSLFAIAPDLRVLTQALRGNTAGGLPEFTMSAFPYSGSWIMRTGWEKRAGYGHFFCSPYPSGGHALPGLRGNNGFYLSLAGQDLLLAGGFGNYSYDHSPIRVDGKEQFALAGIAHGSALKGHKGFAIAYMDPQPPAWRSHSSAAFDFAEGVYDGPYGEFVDDHHDALAITADFLAERARTVLTGICHQRQVIFVKDPGLWVVVDRLHSAQPRRYSLDWRLPTAPIRQFPGQPKAHNPDATPTFAPEAIRIDPTQQSLMTDGTDMANVQIRHFGPKMEFSTARDDGVAVKDDYTIRYKLYDFWRVSGNWKGSGNDVMVSLIEALPAKATTRIKSAESLGDGRATQGFKAILADGRELTFVTALNGTAELATEGMKATAEALLVIGKSGLVLDATKLNDVTPTSSNFEFSSGSTGGNQDFIPIYRPIVPVRIEPARTAIVGPESITLNCATEGMEVRFTLDGTDPTLNSPLYTGPFLINNTTTVKARAFRPGLSKMPGSLAGTLATVTAVAYYTLQEPLVSVAAHVTPGLKADYAEGDWRDLILAPELVKPLKSAVVKNLFDRCKPNHERIFSWMYTGYLTVPEDGVYTFHAPEELTTSKQEPGYSLRLFVGQDRVVKGSAVENLNEWYPATTRHAYGTWSIALKCGLHPFKVVYVDYRTDAIERFNHPGLRFNTIWDGSTPSIAISGPGLTKQPIPDTWLAH